MAGNCDAENGVRTARVFVDVGGGDSSVSPTHLQHAGDLFGMSDVYFGEAGDVEGRMLADSNVQLLILGRR